MICCSRLIHSIIPLLWKKRSYKLTPAEYRLLLILLKCRNRIVKSSYLSIELFGDVDCLKLNILVTNRIQKKTGISIENIKDIGYRLNYSA